MNNFFVLCETKNNYFYCKTDLDFNGYKFLYTNLIGQWQLKGTKSKRNNQ